MKFSLVLVMGLLSASVSFGQSCLQNATSSDLLNEVSRRMGSNGGGSTSSILFSTICSSERLKLRLLNTSSGQTVELSFYTGSDCAEYVTSLARLDGRSINRDVLVAVCESDRLKKIVLSPSGTAKEVSSDYISSGCKKMAVDLNSH